MEKKSKYIYILSLSYENSKLWIRKSEPIKTYFSNLRLLHFALEEAMKATSWGDQSISYSSIYRTLRTRNKFVKTLTVLKVPYFKIEIEKAVLNDTNSLLGLESKP